MAVWNETTLSKIGRYTTLSADYYTPEFERANDIVERIRSQVLPLRRIIEPKFPITYGVLKPREVQSGTFRLARIQNSESLFIFAQDLPPISPIQFDEYARSECRLGDIVLAIGGYIGPLGVISEVDGLRININRHLARISAAKDSIDPYYLAAYLACDISQSLLRREIRGAVQAGINLADLKLHPVFVPSEKEQKTVGDIMRSAEALLRNSRKYYVDAQHLLESELGLDKLTFKKPVGYTVRFSDTLTNGRFDADYYRPQFAAIQQTVKNYSNGYEPLISIAAALKPNIDPSETPNQLYNYIELSNINSTLGTVDGFASMLGKDLPSRARRQVINGDVIASAVVGSVDKAAVIDAAQSGFIASTGFFHFRPISVPSEYLLILVKSKCVRMQFQQQATGGILSAVPDSRLKNIIVPKLPDKLQQKISDLVFQSHRAKRKSQELLEQAKSRVEQLIEEAADKQGGNS